MPMTISDDLDQARQLAAQRGWSIRINAAGDWHWFRPDAPDPDAVTAQTVPLPRVDIRLHVDVITARPPCFRSDSTEWYARPGARGRAEQYVRKVLLLIARHAPAVARDDAHRPAVRAMS